MNWTEAKIKTLVELIKASLTLFAVLGAFFLFLSLIIGEFAPGILAGIFLIFSGIFFLGGLRSIPEEKRWVIEVFGKFYRIYGPGLVWICPIVMRAREAVSVWEQRYPLFERGTEREIKIDFKNGSAVPRIAYAYVQVIGGKEWLKSKTSDDEKVVRENIFKVVYTIKNAKEATTSLIENAARSYLNALTVEEGLEQGRAGYNLLDGMKEKAGKLKKEKKKEDKEAGKKIEAGLKRIDESLATWGLELHRITVGDYDLDKTIIEARENVFRAERDAVAAVHVSKTRARETVGAKLAMLSEATGVPIEELQKEIADNEDLRKAVDELSTDLIKRRMAIDGGSFVDIRVEGAEGGLKDLISLLSVFGRMPAGSKK
jgi:regulator of protease activity HflC (stomatin/prohibitin superfamily)